MRSPYSFLNSYIPPTHSSGSGIAGILVRGVILSTARFIQVKGICISLEIFQKLRIIKRITD
jgi:hypothetical protein